MSNVNSQSKFWPERSLWASLNQEGQAESACEQVRDEGLLLDDGGGIVSNRELLHMEGGPGGVTRASTVGGGKE